MNTSIYMFGTINLVFLLLSCLFVINTLSIVGFVVTPIGVAFALVLILPGTIVSITSMLRNRKEEQHGKAFKFLRILPIINFVIVFSFVLLQKFS